MRPLTQLILMLGAFVCCAAQAQQSEMFGPYELHYSVVNTTFLTPEVAASYGIVRGKKRGILTLAVREPEAQDQRTQPMLLQGRTWDLIQNQTLEFQEIREGEAVYYVAEFKFINEEWRFFQVDFRPEGGKQTHSFQFKHQLYIDE